MDRCLPQQIPCPQPRARPLRGRTRPWLRCRGDFPAVADRGPRRAVPGTGSGTPFLRRRSRPRGLRPRCAGALGAAGQQSHPQRLPGHGDRRPDLRRRHPAAEHGPAPGPRTRTPRNIRPSPGRWPWPRLPAPSGRCQRSPCWSWATRTSQGRASPGTPEFTRCPRVLHDGHRNRPGLAGGRRSSRPSLPPPCSGSGPCGGLALTLVLALVGLVPAALIGHSSSSVDHEGAINSLGLHLVGVSGLGGRHHHAGGAVRRPGGHRSRRQPGIAARTSPSQRCAGSRPWPALPSSWSSPPA